MYSRGFSFVIVLIALALVGGAAVLSVAGPAVGSGQGASIFSWWKKWNKSPAVTSEKQNTNKQTLADIEQQLTSASKSGGISPMSYKDIDTKLKTLESKGVNTKNAPAMLGKLEVDRKSV